MASNKSDSTHEKYEKIPLKMHPRVFSALGADLVTNDVVAVIELVKNSYDAFASNVRLRFETLSKNNDRLVIEDDGQGMTRNVIENVWCLIATPFKETNKIVSSGEKTRRVSGEKGLGRLSVARLGDRLHMITQAPGTECFGKWRWTGPQFLPETISRQVLCYAKSVKIHRSVFREQDSPFPD